MPISAIGSVGGGNNNGGDVTLTLPSGLQYNDLAVVFGGHAWRSGTGSTPTTPGYTLISQYNSGSATGLYFGVWYKQLSGTFDGGSVVYPGTANSADGTAVACIVLRGYGSPILDNTPTSAGPTVSTNPNPASIVVNTGSAWVLALSTSRVSDTSPGTITNYTSTINGNGNDTYPISVAGAARQINSPSTEDPGAWSSWSSGSWVSITVGIKPTTEISSTINSNTNISTSYSSDIVSNSSIAVVMSSTIVSDSFISGPITTNSSDIISNSNIASSSSSTIISNSILKNTISSSIVSNANISTTTTSVIVSNSNIRVTSSSQIVSNSVIKKTVSAGGSNWYNASWLYRVKLTIQASKVDADLTDYPVYIDLSTLPAHFHSNVKANGVDIRVTKGDGQTELAREVVFYDQSSDTGELHFKYSGTLSSTTDTEVYVYYGNTAASDYAVDAEFGRNNVWNDNYRGVWHLPNGTSLTTTDSLGVNDGTPSNISASVGKIGGGASPDNGAGKIDFGDNNSLNVTGASGGATFEFWLKQNGTSLTGTYTGIIVRLDSGVTNGYQIYDLNTNKLLGLYSGGTSFTSTYNVGTDTNWHHYIITDDGENIRFYVDGNLYGDPVSGTITGTTSSVSSQISGYGGINGINGQIDEVRIGAFVSSSSRINTQFNNQNSPSTFYTVSDYELSGYTSDAVIKQTYSSTIISDTEIIGAIVTNSSTITSDSSIKNTLSQSIVSSSIIKQTYSSNIVSDSLIKQTSTSTIVSNSVIRNTYSSAVISNSFIRTTNSSSIVSNSNIQKTYTSLIVSDTYITQSTSINIVSNSIIKKTISSIIISNANISTTVSSSIISNAVIKNSYSSTINSNSVIRNTYISTIISNSVIRNSYSSSIISNTNISVSYSSTIVSNSVLQAPAAITYSSTIVSNTNIYSLGITRTINSNSEIIFPYGFGTALPYWGEAGFGIVELYIPGEETYESSIISNSVITTIEDSAIASDSVIRTTVSSTIVSSSIIRTTEAETITSSSIIRTTSTSVIISDSVIRQTYSSIIISSSAIKNTITSSITSDARISGGFEYSIVSDTVIFKAGMTSTIVSDTNIASVEIRTITSDSVIFNTISSVITSSTVINRLGTYSTINSDSVIRNAVSSTITSSSVITTTSVSTIVSATTIAQAVSSTITSSSVIKKSSDSVIVSDSVIKTTSTSTVVSSTVINKAQSSTIVSSAVILTTGTSTILSSSVIVNTITSTVVSDASITKDFASSIVSNATISSSFVITIVSDSSVFNTMSVSVYSDTFIIPLGYTAPPHKPKTHGNRTNNPFGFINNIYTPIASIFSKNTPVSYGEQDNPKGYVDKKEKPNMVN